MKEGDVMEFRLNVQSCSSGSTPSRRLKRPEILRRECAGSGRSAYLQGLIPTMCDDGCRQ